jgi:biotin carboxyl carrier protein
MPGRVVKLLAAPGDAVKAGDALLVLESMKTETTVRAPRAGRLAALNCAVGDYVADGKVLANIEATAAPKAKAAAAAAGAAGSA